MRVGAIIGLYNTGTGRVLAAFASQQRRAEIIGNHVLAAGEAAMQRKEFEAVLDRIVKRGYENMPSETTVGVTNLSFPIYGPDGEAVAVLTCPHLERIDAFDGPGMAEVTAIYSDVARQLSMSSGGGA